jgi:GTP-binding protein LepA
MNIRNFAIIAHIDHGKSTLADRFLEITGTMKIGTSEQQILDRNPISRERGITIKLAPVRMNYTVDGDEYILNLIDTPGHVDFSYEVDRTLACVEGAILLVDATQGIQAQTISNAYKAIEKNLTIIPVVNKIDLPNAEVDKTVDDIVGFLGCDKSSVMLVSAKTGFGVAGLLDVVTRKVPPPQVSYDSDMRAMIFDSYYDTHRGVIAFVRIVDGQISKGDTLQMCASHALCHPVEVGYFLPDLVASENIRSGDVGYVATNLKDIHDVKVGDTIVMKNKTHLALPGYKNVKPMVFASVFPTDTDDYLNFKKALEKLQLNDSALQYEPVYSQALGTGYRVGFLGLLHADVVRERLEREFALSVVLTPPQVDFIKIDDGYYNEPIVKIMIVSPNQYVGAIMELCERYRARFMTMDNKHQMSLVYEMPLAELISDFFDRLKSSTSGYASLDWEVARYEAVKADKLTLLLNLQPIEEFSEIIVSERAYERAQKLCKALKEQIPRQQYEVKIQAQYKGKIIASERIAPFRKDVLIKNSKVVGAGDVGRKRKLLEKQKEGKKKMKMIGKVEVPKSAFLKIFSDR